MLIFSFCSLHTSYLRLCLVVVLWAAGQGFLSLEWLKFNVFQCFHNVFQCFPKAPGPDSSGLLWGLIYISIGTLIKPIGQPTCPPKVPKPTPFFWRSQVKSDKAFSLNCGFVDKHSSGIRLVLEIRSQIKCALPISSLVQSPACPNV